MTRVISGVLLAAAAVAAILFLPLLALRIVTCAIAALTAHEYVRVAGAPGGATQWILIAAVVAMCWVTSTGLAVDPALLFVIALAWVGAEVLFLGRTMHQAGVALFAPI